MICPRAVTRTARILRARVVRTGPPQVRFQSNPATKNQEVPKAGVSSGITGGLVGGALVLVVGYGYYHTSGVKTIADTASKTSGKFNEVTQLMKKSTPEPSELLKWFRDIVSSCAVFIPGAKRYVDVVFHDLEKVEQKHQKEVNDILSRAYSEIGEATKGGLSIESAQKTWEILEKYLKQLGGLATDSASDILDNHPELKEKVGGNLNQLKSLAKSYGPEAKKELDQTYSQIKEAIASGVSAGSVEKIRKIVQDKLDKVKSIGNEAWKKGLEQAKPFLDKNPQIKELLEKNQDALKSGNVAELYQKIEEGNVDSIQDYIKQSTSEAMNGGLGQNMEQYVKMIPGGDKIIPRLSQLQEVARKYGAEAEKILKETYDEIADILDGKTKDMEKLAEKAKENEKK